MAIFAHAVPQVCVDRSAARCHRRGTVGGQTPEFQSSLDGDVLSCIPPLWKAGCKRVWFSFKSCDAEAVDHAREKGLEVVEIGRCPVYYMDKQVAACKAHTLVTKLTGTYRHPPQTDAKAKRRELF